MKRRLLFVALCLISLLFSSCNKNEEPEDLGKKRTLIIYLISENSLIQFESPNIELLLSAAPTLKNGEEIVIYIDGIKTPAIYTIDNKTKATELTELTPEYEYTTDQNSCSGVALSEFLGYVKTKHPSDEYGLVLWSHGSGWIPSYNYADSPNNFARRRSFGVDNGRNTNSNEGNQMCISELHNALKSMGQKFDYILFDCCFMQCVENAYELRDVTKYIIGSPAEIPGPGAPYGKASVFFLQQDCVKQITQTYYSNYEYTAYGSVISVCDCSQMDAFASATRTLVQKYKDEILAASYGNVLDYFQYDLYRNKSPMPDFYDINSIFRNYASAADYASWKSAFDKAYPYALATKYWFSEYPYARRSLDIEQYGGASMYVPLQKYSTDLYAPGNKFFVNAFSSSQWAKDVWGY